MQVRKLDTLRRRDVRQFIRLPFQLYEDCPQWVPPLLPDMRLALDRQRYPFYRHSDADFYLVESEGQALARLVVFEHRPYNAFHENKTAFFYYFDAADDAQATDRLFAAAFDWARSRGLTEIYGPNGMLRSDGHGLLVEGFEHRPAIGIKYNYPYYEQLVQSAGLKKSHDYYSGYVNKQQDLPQRFYDVAERIKARRGYRVRALESRRELRSLAPVFYRVYERAFVQVWGYYPVDLVEIEAMIRRISLIADPRLIKIVLKGDDPVGFIIAYPDVSAAIQRIRGRLWPFGWIRLLVESRSTKWVNFNGVGVLPEYQGVGANTVLYTELAGTFKDGRFRFEHGDVVQVAETNAPSLGDLTAAGPALYKTHRVYHCVL
jgi:GNAT superfamily N-acetyltransferase